MKMSEFILIFQINVVHCLSPLHILGCSSYFDVSQLFKIET